MGAKGTSGGKLGKVLMLMRLMRILRLVRLVKAVRPLYQLAQGIIKAMQAMFWVLVLTMVALYASAILSTRMVGHAMIAARPEDIPAEVRDLFGTVGDSMFTLFGLMNGQYWRQMNELME